MNSDDEQCPPHPTIPQQTNALPAKSAWMALLWSATGAVCLALLNRFNIYGWNEVAWFVVSAVLVVSLTVGVILGIKTYRFWQGLLAMVVAIACVGLIGYAVGTHPYKHQQIRAQQAGGLSQNTAKHPRAPAQ